MRTYLVTGGAGFIGSNYIHYMFDKYGDDIRIINVDKLTYAGNLENLKDIESRANYTFVKADICDKDAITKAKDSKLVVSIEEHHINGGLGSAISDFTSSLGAFPPLFKLGVGNDYSEVGDYEYLLKQHRLMPEMIAEDILNKYQTV